MTREVYDYIYSYSKYLLRQLFPRPADVAILRTKIRLFMDDEVAASLTAFMELGTIRSADIKRVSTYFQPVIAKALVNVARSCDLTTRVWLVKYYDQIRYLKIPLLIALARAVADQVTNGRDLTTVLDNFVLTEQDLADGSGVVDFHRVSVLLPWYQPDSRGWQELIKFVKRYPVNQTDLVTYLVAGPYMVWPIPVESITWKGFVNTGVAAYYLRRNYGRVDLAAVSSLEVRPVVSSGGFGGVSKDSLQVNYNLIELP